MSKYKPPEPPKSPYITQKGFDVLQAEELSALLASASYESKTGQVFDAAVTAKQGVFLKVPTIICRNIE